ncbi:MAG TPA: ABC transporter permease [Acidobacteriaceae bacterium]|jgi:putative ABC transport system permease protein|nr:ABC transporter permease [Acidobacteriaceae bacterium]
MHPFRRAPRDPDFDREIAFHIDQLTQAGIAAGLSPEEARRRAILDFGGREQIRQQIREVHLIPLLATLRFNVRAALRFLRRSPSFSIAVILTLALGVGANSAVFSAIDAVVLRPLPYPQADQLVQISQRDTRNRDANHFVAPIRLEEWNRLNSTFQAISGYYTDDLSETSGPLPERVTMAFVAPRFLQVLGISPSLGRDFTAEEERFGGPDAALISHAYWMRRFHGDPAALGQKLHVGSFAFSIVGIMPASFAFPSRDIAIWAPSPPDAPYAQRRDATWFTVIGRLKPNVTLARAQTDLATVQARLGQQYPKPDAGLTVRTVTLKSVVVGDAGASFWLLYASVSLLLLIACSNIAALLLARTADREHEISIRFSLGASRRAIVGQLLTEVFLLALLGSLLGLAIAAVAARAFHLLADTFPRAMEIRLNWTVVLYSLLCAVATSVLCGLFPALRGTRRTLAHSLAQGSRTQASARHPLQWFLVAVQVTLAVTLLTGAGLLIRSLQQLDRVSPGFDPTHLLTFQVSGSWGETADTPSLTRRIDRTLDALRAIPGVEDAATAGALPGASYEYPIQLRLDGSLDPNRKIIADQRFVSSGYFATMRIPLLQGQSCREGSPATDLLVNRSFVQRYLGDGPALDHQLVPAEATALGVNGQIKGVVGDAREDGLNLAPGPTVYACFSAPSPFPNYLVRTHGDPMALAETIRRRIHQIEPTRSVYAVMLLEQHLDEAFAGDRLRTMLLVLFAATAVVLACIGLYGTLNYLGRMRRREVGVRLALGASRARILRQFLFQGMRVTLLGCAAGLALSVAAGRLLAGMLFGVSAVDPLTYAAVLLLILAVATAASLLPAWRAARVEPVLVLRQE